MNLDVLSISAFGGGILTVMAVSQILKRFLPENRLGDGLRLHQEFYRQKNGDPASPLFKDLSKIAEESIAETRALSVRERYLTMIEQSDLKIAPAFLLIVSVLTGLALAMLGGFLAYWIGGHMIAGVAVGLAGVLIPVSFVHWKRTRRLDKMLGQLPDALDLMVTVMKAGRTMTHAMQEVADHFQQPISTEFANCIAQQDMGLHPEAALRDLARRTGLLEVKIFVLTLLIQRASGGSFTDLLERLADVIRQRFRVRAQVRALTGEGRLQALTLAIIAPALFTIMMFLNRRYTEVLLERPDLLGAMLASMIVGALWIRRIVNFDF